MELHKTRKHTFWTRNRLLNNFTIGVVVRNAPALVGEISNRIVGAALSRAGVDRGFRVGIAVKYDYVMMEVLSGELVVFWPEDTIRLQSLL